VPGQAINDRSALYELVDVEPLKKGAPNFIVRFTEDKNGFYIHGRKFEPAAGPTTSARIGTYQRVLSANPPNRILSAYTRSTSLLVRKTVSRSRILQWLDTINVLMAALWMSSLDLPAPVTKGMPTFHCHLLN
jgi:hypothetical protein